MIPEIKFVGFSPAKQQKELAALLKRFWVARREEELIHYNKLICLTEACHGWKEIDITMPSKEEIADRYHVHLKLAGIHLREHGLLSRVRSADRQVACPSWPIDLVLDGIRSAHNVGSILRTAEAFAFDTIYLAGLTAGIDNKKVCDAAMGADAWVRTTRFEGYQQLRRPLIALETVDGAFSIYKIDFPDSFTLALGNEEYGISSDLLREADLVVEIPLRGKKNSLNVANAFACVAGEIMRQRSVIGS